jgi:hypothetical protein
MFATSPICDQGGECDLQDITFIFGSDRSRFYEYNKRSVFDKECGVFVKMIMTRCIHCTRCVRFLSEVSDESEFGMLNRGNNSEISTYIQRNLYSELSGNIIDLCPVGALTSKPFAFVARSWELNSLESVDIFDSLASSIRVDFLNNKIYRILPVYEKNINDDWITNKIRFCYDCQKNQRLNFPFFNLKSKFLNINWDFSLFIFYYFFFNFFNKNINIFVGEFNDLNSILNLKLVFNFISVEISFIENFYFNIDFRQYFFFDFSIIDFSYLFIFNLNLRNELPLVNTKVIKYFKKNNLKIFNFLNNSYFGLFVGNNFLVFKEFLNYRNFLLKGIFFKKYIFSIFNFKKLLKFTFLFNFYFFKNSSYLINYINFFLNKNFIKLIINFVISNITYLNFFEVGFFFRNKLIFKKENFIILFNVDNNLFLNKFLKQNLYKNFIVYLGSFFDFGAKISNLNLPLALFFEFNGFFLNLEGKFRKLNKIINTSFYVQNLSDILNSFFILFNLKFNDNFYVLKFFKKFLNFFNFFRLNLILNLDYNLFYLKFFYFNYKFNFKFEFENKLFFTNVYNYYKHDVISRNSKVLNLASLEFINSITLL